VFDFRKLETWQVAKDLSLAIYRATTSFPAEERYGLASQIRRSVQSIGANLAEGCGYGGGLASARFFQIAFGSASETHHHLIVAHELGWLDDTGFEDLESRVLRVKQMLTQLLRRTRSNNRRSAIANRSIL